MKEENICLKQKKDHIITRLNGWKNNKIPDCTFFYGQHKSKYNYINIRAAFNFLCFVTEQYLMWNLFIIQKQAYRVVL